MTKRTRLFLLVAAGILVVGLGTGLLASYMGVQNFALFGSDGPPELAYVAPDARIVGFANVREIMDSELRQKLMELQPGSSDGADHLQEQTGIDIRRDVDSVVAVIAGGDDDARPLLLARGVFDTARIEALIVGHGGAVEEYQGQRLIVHEGNALAVGFLESGLAAVGTPVAIRRAIDTKVAGNDVRDNAEVMRLVQNIDNGNAWLVARFDAITGGPQLPEELAKQLPPITWFSASGSVNGGVRGVLHAEARDETAANDLRDVIRGFVALARMQTGQRAELADLMNSLELGGQGNTVSLGFSVPPELIDALGALHGRQFPGAPEPEAGL